MKKWLSVSMTFILIASITTGCVPWITDWIAPKGESLKSVVENGELETQKYLDAQTTLPQTEMTEVDDLLAFTRLVKIADLNHIIMSNGSQETTFALAGIKVPDKADKKKIEETINRILSNAVDVVIESTSKTEISKDKDGYVYAYIRADGVLLNEALVRDGLLVVDETKKSDSDSNYNILIKAETSAKENNMGVWKTTAESNAPTSPTPTPTSNSTNTDTPDSSVIIDDVPPSTNPNGEGSNGSAPPTQEPESAIDKDISIKYEALTSSIKIASKKNVDVDISSWIVQDSTAKSAIAMPENTVLKAGETFSIRLGKPDAANKTLNWDHTIDNAYTKLELYNANAQLVTSVN